MDPQSHYSLLGIAPDATPDAITDALRQARRRWSRQQEHPNLERRHEAELRLRDLAEAERVLTDPTRRAAYDAALPAPVTPTSPTPAGPTPPVPTPPPTAADRPWELPRDATPSAAPEPGARPVPGPAGASPDAAAAPVGGFPVDRLIAWVKGNRAVAGGIAAAVVVVIACTVGFGAAAAGHSANADTTGAQQQDSGSDDTSSNTDTNAAASTPTPTAPTTFDLSGLDPTYADGGLYANQRPVLLDSGTAFDPDVSAIGDQGQQVSVQSVVSATAGDGQHPVALVQVETPAVDLTPASVADELVFYGVDGSGITAKATLSTSQGTSYDGPDYGLDGSATSTIVVTVPGDDDDTTQSIAYDATTGSQLWSTSGATDHTTGSVAIVMTTAPEDADGDACVTARGVALADGHTVWTVATPPSDDGWECEDLQLEHTDIGDRYAAFSASGDPVVVRTDTGAHVQWKDGVDQDDVVDPVTGAVFFPGGSDAASPAVVIDPVTGAQQWSMPGDQATNLDLQVTAMYGGRIYATTTDQHVLIDVATGSTVAGGWQISPTVVVGDQVLWSDGVLRPASDTTPTPESGGE